MDCNGCNPLNCHPEIKIQDSAGLFRAKVQGSQVLFLATLELLTSIFPAGLWASQSPSGAFHSRASIETLQRDSSEQEHSHLQAGNEQEGAHCGVQKTVLSAQANASKALCCL